MALPNLLKRETHAFLFITLSSASLVAATESSSIQGVSVFGVYAYWIIRILTEAFLFFAFREVIERYLLPNSSAIITGALAFALSLVPFVLSITAFDLILGYPELGLENTQAEGHGRLTEFALELLYLSDNHLALCLLLSVVRIFKFTPVGKTAPSPQQAPALHRVVPRLSGSILWINAQEHYVKIVTTKETRTVLYRLSDLVKDLQAYPGMQVHRSHWIAFDAVEEIQKTGQGMKIRLSTGDVIPVSRTYRTQLTEQLKTILPV